jgi:hypothetical protein
VDPHRYDWLDKQLSSCGKEMEYNVGLRNSSWCDTGKQQYKAWTWEARADKRKGRIRKSMLNPEVPTRRSPRTGIPSDCSAPLMTRNQVDALYEDFVEGGESSTPSPSGTLETPSQAAAAISPAVKMERKKIKRWIQYTFEGMGMPSRLKGTGVDQWMGKGGVVAAIIAHLDITMQAKHVVKVLERTYDAFLEGKLATFDAGVHTFKKKKLRMNDQEVQLALKCVRDNLGLDLTTKRVNTYRKRTRGANDKGVARETVRMSMERWGALCHNRQTRKTGDRSLTSTWAMFRHRFAIQVNEQCDPNISDDARTEGWFRIHRDGILFVDEHHEKCNMGKANTSKKEWPCAVHKDDDTQFVPLFLDDGITKNPDARFLKCNPRPKAKYESECRGLFGVCMVKDAAGKMEGKKMVPYDYTGCLVTGGKGYIDKCRAKFLHIQNTDSWKNKTGYWKEGGGLTMEDNPFINK